MNTKAELQFWIEFAQKDLSRIKKKTRYKLHDEIDNKLTEYSSFLGALQVRNMEVYRETIKEFDEIQERYLSTHQEYAKFFLDELKKVIEKEKNSINSEIDEIGLQNYTGILEPSKVEFIGYVYLGPDGTFSSHNVSNSILKEQIYFYLSMLLNGINLEDFKNCEYCGKIFLQVSREKRFCTRNCAANSAKR